MQKFRCTYWSSLHWTRVVERLCSRYITALRNRICSSLASTMNQTENVVATINIDALVSVSSMRDDSTYGLYLIIERSSAINFLRSILHVWRDVSDLRTTLALFIEENIDNWQDFSGIHGTWWSWQMRDGENWILQFYCQSRRLDNPMICNAY